MVDNPVGWFEIYVENMDRAKKFYESVFNIKLERMESSGSLDIEMWLFPSNMEKPGVSGALVKMKDFSPGRGGTVIYFPCENCAIEETKVETAGGQVQMRKTSVEEQGFFSLIEDTEGNLFGLHSME